MRKWHSKKKDKDKEEEKMMLTIIVTWQDGRLWLQLPVSPNLSSPLFQGKCLNGDTHCHHNVITVTHIVTNHDNIGDIVDARKDCH